MACGRSAAPGSRACRAPRPPARSACASRARRGRKRRASGRPSRCRGGAARARPRSAEIELGRAARLGRSPARRGRAARGSRRSRTGRGRDALRSLRLLARYDAPRASRSSTRSTELYFRVRSQGHEHLPERGRGRARRQPRRAAAVRRRDGRDRRAAAHGSAAPARSIVDRWAGTLPWINVFFARVGQVIGTRENFADLLDDGQLVLVFPEGIEGIRKPVTQRYRLQAFHVGFVEQALRARAPIMPMAFIGSDDQAPILYDMKPLARAARAAGAADHADLPVARTARPAALPGPLPDRLRRAARASTSASGPTAPTTRASCATSPTRCAAPCSMLVDRSRS